MRRIAIAGAGAGGALHASAVASLRGTDLVAIAATTAGNAEFLAVQAETLAIDMGGLPAGADAVVVATTVDSHLGVALPLIDRGIPALVEKPLAATLAETDRLIEAARGTGSLLCYAENLLFAPAIDATVQRLQEMGEITNLEIRFHQPPPEPVRVGAIGTVGPSAVALALLYGGNASVSALRCRAQSSRDDGLDDAARIELRFSSKVIAVIDVGWSGDDTGTDHVEWSTQLASAETVLSTRLVPESTLEVNGAPVDVGGDGARLPEGEGATEARRLADLGFIEQMKGFVAAAAGSGGRVCPAGFGQLVLEVIYAAYESAANDGEEVAFPFGGDRTSAPDDVWLRRG